MLSPESATWDKNLFAYCDNNPVNRNDNGGQFWNVVIGAVVGAVLSTATQIISNVIGGKTWHSGVVGAAIVGGISGAIAATGLGAFAQAAWTGVAAATGDAIQQGIDKGFDQIDPIQSIRTGLAAGMSSGLGSYAGKKLLGGINDVGQSLISKGHQKNLTGIYKQINGKSHTHYYRSGTALVTRGKIIVNFYRGSSSCLGSLLGMPIGLWNNYLSL